MKHALSLYSQPIVYITAIKVALVVGTILALINHGPALFNGSLSTQNIAQILLTYLVPYSVSSYSSVNVILQSESP